MCAGVSKSGSPISRCTISLPCRSSALARARTSNADSVPRRAIREATFIETSLEQGASQLRTPNSLCRSGHSTLASVDFIRIPAGSFTMGWAHGAPSERPAHLVWVDAFEITVTPVTNADFARYRAAVGAPAAPFAAREGFDDPGQPVVGLSWETVTVFAAWAG